MLLPRLTVGLASASVALAACTAPRNERSADTVPVAADSPENAGAAGALLHTSWRLTHLGDTPALEHPEATLEFLEDGRVTGVGSCNRFSGPVEVEEAAIDFGVLAATRMACAEEVMRQETRYFTALNEAARWEQSGDTLLIHHPGGGPLRFARRAPAR